MEPNDKTFRDAVEDLKRHLFTLSTEEEAFKQIVKLDPIVQQARKDGRTLESVVPLYFPQEAIQKAMLSLYRSVMLRSVLDKAFQAGFLSQALHTELVLFVRDLLPDHHI